MNGKADNNTALPMLMAEDAGSGPAEYYRTCPGTFIPEGEYIPGDDELCLFLDGKGLSLKCGAMTVSADLSGMKKRIRSGLSREMLIRAVKIRGRQHLRVIDAAAGLGEDAFLMAASGMEVFMYERDPVIALLLEDALRRAGEDEEIRDIAARMKLIKGDSIPYMRSGADCPDVIFLDPMFPQRSKSGLIKKKFQLLQRLELPCDDEEELMGAALASGAERIVIKRPAKGAFLAGRKPDYSIEGSSVRYDCIVLRTGSS